MYVIEWMDSDFWDSESALKTLNIGVECLCYTYKYDTNIMQHR